MEKMNLVAASSGVIDFFKYQMPISGELKMLNNMKVGSRLIGGFLAVAVIATIIGVVGLVQMRNMDDEAQKMADNRLPGIAALLQMSEAHSAIDGSENALLSTAASEAERQSA